MSSSSPLRLVQVGAGAMGRTWLRAIADSVDTVLVGLVDLDPELARVAAREAGHHDVAVNSSLAALLDRVEADAVVNVTVPLAHHPVNGVALRAGLPVLCEKPLAESVATALASVATAEHTGQRLVVSQSRRYFRHLDAFRAQIAQLGPATSLRCAFHMAPRFPGFREEMVFPLLIDMAIHPFDLSRLLVGADPVAVYCESYNPSWSPFRGDAAADVIVEYADGTRFSYSGTWCSPGLETSWNGQWIYNGQHGTATWDGDHAPVAQDAQGRPVLAPSGTGPEESEGSLAEFVHVVRSGDVPGVEARSNVLSLAIVEAATRSATTSTRVQIDDVLNTAYAEALRVESDPDVRAVLAGWGTAQQGLALQVR